MSNLTKTDRRGDPRLLYQGPTTRLPTQDPGEPNHTGARKMGGKNDGCAHRRLASFFFLLGLGSQPGSSPCECSPLGTCWAASQDCRPLDLVVGGSGVGSLFCDGGGVGGVGFASAALRSAGMRSVDDAKTSPSWRKEEMCGI